MKKKLRLTPALLMLLSQALYASGEGYYIVKDGDTLSTIAQSQIGPPVYQKKRGSLAQLKLINPWLGQGDLIFPGQILLLEKSETRFTSKAAQNTREPADTPQSTTPPAATAVALRPALAPAPTLEATQPNKAPQTVKATSIDPTSCTPAKGSVSLDQEVPNKLLLSVDYGVTTLSAEDASGNKAELFSNYDVTAKGFWKQEWTANFSTALGASLRAIDFDPSSSQGKSLSGTSTLLPGLSLMGENKFNHRFSLQYGAAYQPELFVHGTNTSLIAIDSVPLPSLRLGATVDLFSISRIAVGLRGDFSYLFSGSTEGYSIGGGQEYQSLLFVRRKYGSLNYVEGDLGYRYRIENTSIVQLNESSAFGSLIFSLPLFEGDGR